MVILLTKEFSIIFNRGLYCLRAIVIAHFRGTLSPEIGGNGNLRQNEPTPLKNYEAEKKALL
jgi:hypothetical protein